MFRKVAVTFLASLLGASALAGSAEAAINNDVQPQVSTDKTFAFDGTFTADASRTFTKAPVRVSGQITIDWNAMDVCPAGYTKASYGLYVQDVVTLASIDGYHIWEGTTAGSYPVSVQVQGAPGSYRLHVRSHCWGSTSAGLIAIDVLRDKSETISIAGMESYRMLTRITDRDGDENCVGQALTCMPPQLAEISLGLSVTLWYTAAVTWTDGLQTTEHPCKPPFSTMGWSCTHQLQFRKVGGDWRSLGGGNQSIKPTESGEYRFAVGSLYTEPAMIRVPTATAQMRFVNLAVTPQRAEVGSALEITSSISILYSDGVWRDAQDGSQVSVEFLPSGSSDWRAVGPTGSISAGRVRVALQMPGTGLLRLRVGGNVSDSVRVAVPGATETVRFSPIDGPLEVGQGQAATLTARVEAQWDDGSWRDAPNATPIILQFAPAATASDSPNSWLDIATGSSANGVVTFSRTPFANGLWRLKAEKVSSNSVFIKVRGLAPLRLNAVMAESEVGILLPNQLTDISYRLTLDGYAGGDRPTVFVTVPGGSATRLGSVDSQGNLQGTVSFRTPNVEGALRLSFEARDAQGRVLVTTEEAGLRIEKAVGFRPTLNGPRQASEGSRVNLVASLSVVTSSGALIPTQWTGQVHLEAAEADSSWRRVASLSGSGRDSVSFSVPASSGTSYRVTGEGMSEFSEVISPQVLKYSGRYRFANETSSQATVSKGGEVLLSADLQGELGGGEYADSPDGVDVALQRSTSGEWVTVAKLRSADGRVETRVAVGSSTSYRFVAPDGSTSRSITVRVRSTGPDSLQVTWPTRVSGVFRVVASLKSGGQLWTKPVQVQLQLKPSGSNSWATLDKEATRQGRVTLSTNQLKTGTWRVVVIGHPLEDARVYGSA